MAFEISDSAEPRAPTALFQRLALLTFLKDNAHKSLSYKIRVFRGCEKASDFFFLMACKEILLKIKEKLLHLITATTEREAPCVGGLFKFVETIYQLSQPQCPVFITHIMCHST